MSKISDTYGAISYSIVAIASRVSKNPDFPDILGTGFVVHDQGIIFTCGHVINAINRLSRRKGAPPAEIPAFVILFQDVPGKGMATVPMNIVGVGGIAAMGTGEYYYGPKVRDIGFIAVNFVNLKPLKFVPKLELREGDSIAIAGFPLGTETLRAPGWLHQLAPTLQTGIISAILPFPCDNPHGILLDLMAKGDSSGSPVFACDSGEVVGMVYGGINEQLILNGGSAGALFYQNPTTLTLAVPSHFLSNTLSHLLKEGKVLSWNSEPVDFKTIISDESKWKIRKPKTPGLEPCEIETFGIEGGK